MTIYEYDERLYRLLKRCLFGNYVSAAADELTPAMRRGLLSSVDSAIVGTPCGCGDDDCRSFGIQGATNEPTFNIRFHVEGELMVRCDAAGTLLRVSWQPDVRVAAGTRRCYCLTSAGWEEVDVASI